MMRGPNRVLVPMGVVAMIVMCLMPVRQWKAPEHVDLEPAVPMLESTPTADAGPLFKVVFGKLPPPAPNQITEKGKCLPPGEWIRGACWMPVAKQKPPCDPMNGEPRKMWPHEDLCWVPMAEAKPVPTTGGGRVPGVASPD